MVETDPKPKINVELEEFVLQALNRLGALLQPDGAGAWETLLPEALAQKLGKGEFLRFSRESRAGAERLAFGAPWIDRLLEQVAQECVPIAELALSEGSGGAVAAAERAAAARLDFKNMALKGIQARPARGSLLLCTFRYQAQCEDSFDGLIELLLDEETGVALESLPRLMELLPLGVPQARFEPLRAPRRILEPAYAAAESIALVRIEPFKADIERHRSQDAERLHLYYEGLLRDLAVARVSEASAAQLEEKRRAIERDYGVKCAELQLRSRIELKLRLVALLRVTLPCIQVEIDALRRQARLSLKTQYFPALRELKRLACPACRRACEGIWACDEGHMACDRPGCFGACAACERRTCPLCHKDPLCKCGKSRKNPPREAPKTHPPREAPKTQGVQGPQGPWRGEGAEPLPAPPAQQTPPPEPEPSSTKPKSSSTKSKSSSTKSKSSSTESKSSSTKSKSSSTKSKSSSTESKSSSTKSKSSSTELKAASPEPKAASSERRALAAPGKGLTPSALPGVGREAPEESERRAPPAPGKGLTPSALPGVGREALGASERRALPAPGKGLTPSALPGIGREAPGEGRALPAPGKGLTPSVFSDAGRETPGIGLEDLLRREISVTPAAAREALRLEQAELRRQIQQLVAQGKATIEGHGRGITYHWKPT